MNRRSGGPNLLFLMSDQHTQRVAGCYGDGVVRTPALDRLADRGVVFENAYCPSPICVPSRMSLLTGCYPATQSCWTNSDTLASDRPTMAHALGAAGYRPALVGRLHALGPDQLHGYAERYVGDHSPNWIGVPRHSLGVLERTNDPFRDSLRKSGPGQSAYQLHDADVTDAACAWLEDRAARRRAGDVEPFSLTLGFMLPHQPYVARREDYDPYDGKVGLPDTPPPDPGREHPYLAWWRESTDTRAVTDAETLRARTAYYGLVTRLDAMIGRVLDTLDRLALDRDTLIVYTTDHGDQLGERGLWWKQTFYDESAKVPLIVAWPGRLPAGTRRRQLVNLVDLAPTVLEALVAPPLPNADGRSFWPVALDADHPWPDETFSEYCTDALEAWAGTTPVQQRMLRTRRWKLNYYHGHRPQLFDMARDPRETTDLGDEPGHAAVRDGLTARLLATWDPEAIARRMRRRRLDKDLVGAWCRTVQPPDAYRWQLRMEDNWLGEPPGA
jgi:choline-sulfatase